MYVRLLKLSHAEPGQHLDGRPPTHIMQRNVFETFLGLDEAASEVNRGCLGRVI